MTSERVTAPHSRWCVCGGDPAPYDLSDPASPRVVESLTRRCDLCKAPVGQLCTNPIRPGTPLPGRVIHLIRIGRND